MRSAPARRPAAIALLSLLLGLLAVGGAAPAVADSFVPISGAGSTWSSNAIDQWRRNVNQYGLTVNYASTGSTDGRNQFRNGTVDFGVSEIPYGLQDSAGVVDPPPARNFAYMPIVAGGTSFMYNLKIGGQRVTNLRLSGENMTKIFTGVLTQWNDPAIAADNPGLTLPTRKIVPVVRSDGSGTTAQFTLWMSKQYGGLWDDYCGKQGLSQRPCGQTSDYPKGDGMVAQAGSLGVSGYVSQAQNEGTITYVEYSYALNTGYPVAKLLNKAGYYNEPTAPNVAVALLGATINPDLTQNLDGVYNNPDPRSYALSSYSYMILPTKEEGSFSTAKGNSLSSFSKYFLCEGQQQAPVLGYSPLPKNLVQAGLDQVNKIPGHTSDNVDISKCNNPTFSSDGSNTLAKTAPQPAECDKQGPNQCSVGSGGAKNVATVVKPAAAGAGTGTSGAAGPATRAGTGKARTATPGTAPGQAPAVGGGTTAAGVSPPAAGAPASGASGGAGTGAAALPGAAAPVINPDTGQVVPAAAGAAAVGPDGAVAADNSAAAGTAGGAAPVAAVPVSLSSGGMGGASSGALTLLAVLLLLAAVVVPPLLSRRPARRGEA